MSPADPPIPELLAREGALYYRELPNGMAIVVWPMGWGQGYLCLSDGLLHHDTYAYRPASRAVEAARAWSGEGDPLAGWHRHLNTGRRREGGDPDKETVRW